MNRLEKRAMLNKYAMAAKAVLLKRAMYKQAANGVVAANNKPASGNTVDLSNMSFGSPSSAIGLQGMPSINESANRTAKDQELKAQQAQILSDRTTEYDPKNVRQRHQDQLQQSFSASMNALNRQEQADKAIHGLPTEVLWADDPQAALSQYLGSHPELADQEYYLSKSLDKLLDTRRQSEMDVQRMQQEYDDYITRSRYGSGPTARVRRAMIENKPIPEPVVPPKPALGDDLPGLEPDIYDILEDIPGYQGK